MSFEIAGLGLLLPLLKIISDPSTLNEPYILIISKTLNINKDQVLYLLIGLTLFFNVMKMFVLVFLNYKQNRILNEINANLSIKLFDNFLALSQENFTKLNSATIQKKINTDTNHFMVYCSSHITVIVEIAIIISIIMTVILIEPLGTFFLASVLFILSIIFFSISKRKIILWGNKRDSFEDKLSFDVLEGLRAFKEINIYNASKYFVNKFKIHKNKVTILNSYVQTLNALPRYFLELMSVFCIVTFLLYMITLNKPLGELISILGLIVAATFKLLPSANKILSSLQNIKYYSSSINFIEKALKEINKTINKKSKSEIFDFSKTICLEELTFRYKENETNILENLNLKIEPGTAVGIIGSSGVGKSTLVDLLVGLLKPTSGKIEIGGNEIHNNINLWKKNIGYIPQDIFLTDTTILENIGFGLHKNEIENLKLNQAIKSSELENYIKDLPQKLFSSVGEGGVQISGGQRQRIGIARALYKNPELLILDEATSALDEITESKILRALFESKSQNKTIIFITHRLSALKYCDCVYELKKGKLIKNH